MPLPESGRPRVLAISRDRVWDGKRDLELNSALDALAHAGMDIVVLAVSIGEARQRLFSLQSRPKMHLFEEISYLAWNWSPLPPGLGLNRMNFPLASEGLDWNSVAIDYLTRVMPRLIRDSNRQMHALWRLSKRLGARAALLTDENGGSHALKLGLKLSGIPVIAVQHGVIHEHHLSYMYPPGTSPEEIPLCDKTCVYGPRIKRLLTERSVYRPESVVVTGQPQNDARGQGARPWMSRTEAMERLRRAVLPSDCDRLLLFTSQHIFFAALAPRLLDALAKSHPRHFLLVRPHPLEENPQAFWTNAFESHGVASRAKLQSEGGLDDALQMCDVHLSGTSTVLGEALIFGRPNIVLGAPQFGDFMGVLEAGAAVELEKYPSLDAAVDVCVDQTPSAVARWEQNRLRYIEEYFFHLDGRAGERIAQVVEDAIAGRRGSGE